MEELWSRLIELMRPHAPEVADWLNVGATDEQIRKAEEEIGVRFPNDVAAFYRAYNGQKSDSPYFWQGSEIYSLERVVENWTLFTKMWEGGEFEGLHSEPRGPIRPDWWNPRWVPITLDAGRDGFYCLDLDPTEGGELGQIITFWHDCEARTRIAPSFLSWFEEFVTGCETGRYQWWKKEQVFILVGER